jgi:hypothetical protein
MPGSDESILGASLLGTGQIQEGCRWCGGFHNSICPTIKAMEYYPDGTVKRVEFKPAQDYAAPLDMLAPVERPKGLRGVVPV